MEIFEDEVVKSVQLSSANFWDEIVKDKAKFLITQIKKNIEDSHDKIAHCYQCFDHKPYKYQAVHRTVLEFPSLFL